MIRLYFYTISGIISAIIGWNLSQFFWVDLGQFFSQKNSPLDAIVLPPPDLVLLPVAAASLAVGMVIAEIFLSNPTRYKANLRVLPPYFWLALTCGAITGLISAASTWLMYASQLPGAIVRIACWGLVGLFTGLGEGISWRLRSIEGETNKATQRLWKGTLFGLGAGMVAAIIVEIVRNKIPLGGYEDPISFMILGCSLGFFLSLAASPSYQVALRAGAGFEVIEPDESNSNIDPPRLQSDRVRFVTEDESEIIEEGLSIQLPNRTNSKDPIIIGSDSSADIYLPNIPNQCVLLHIKSRKVTLECLASGAVQINRRKMYRKGQKQDLKHNQILTIFRQDNLSKFYCLCFYDKFLDPQG